MASDLRVIDRPLRKRACTVCGYTGVSGDSPLLDFGDYELYAHAPGRKEERARQAAFARWIAELVPAPVSVFDAGCGNGSLLVELHEHWPAAVRSGRDPAAAAVAFARAAGIDAQVGSINASEATASRSALVISINVIEHTRDPLAFVRGLAKRVDPSGLIVLIAPDGAIPSAELLIADHRHSFYAEHLGALCERADLVVVRQERAPHALGALVATIARPRTGLGSLPRTFADPGPTIAAQVRFLGSWAALERKLRARLPEPRRLVAFGVGEAAGMLRAYAPAVWELISCCTVDTRDMDRFGDRPVIEASDLRTADAVIVAVRPAAAASVAARLEAAGHTAIRYDDLIAEPTESHT